MPRLVTAASYCKSSEPEDHKCMLAPAHNSILCGARSRQLTTSTRRWPIIQQFISTLSSRLLPTCSYHSMSFRIIQISFDSLFVEGNTCIDSGSRTLYITMQCIYNHAVASSSRSAFQVAPQTILQQADSAFASLQSASLQSA